MATPITLGAAVFEVRKLRHRRGRRDGRASGRCSSGCSRRSSPGILAIGFLLRYLRTRSLTIFVVYRLVLAAVVVVAWLR